MSNCITEIDVCVIRGDTFTMDVALNDDWVEVIKNPSQYRSKLVFREFQDDNSPPLLTLIATPQLIPDRILSEPPVMISFEAAGSVTQTLPNFDIVGFCEIYLAAVPSPTRLFNMQVQISD